MIYYGKMQRGIYGGEILSFSVILVITGLLAGSALSGGKDSFLPLFCRPRQSLRRQMKSA